MHSNSVKKLLLKLHILFALLLLAPSLLTAQSMDNNEEIKYVTRSWEGESSWYKITIQKEDSNGIYEFLYEEFLEVPSFTLPFSQGKYRYQVTPYQNRYGRPSDYSSEWMDFGVRFSMGKLEIVEPEPKIQEPLVQEPEAPVNIVLEPEPEVTEPEIIKQEPKDSAKLCTVGLSGGLASSTPRYIVTARGTIAPLPFSFLELGLDFGWCSRHENDGYFSLRPFVHLAFYWPFSGKIGAYVGAGGGYMTAWYTFEEGHYAEGSQFFWYLDGDIIAGVNIFNWIDLSYTFRINFKSCDRNHKVSLGCTKRFNR